MKKSIIFLSAMALTTAFAATSFADAPSVYVVNFRNNTDVNSQKLDTQLASALAISGINAEEVVIDTSTAAKWEKGAHDAFDRDIVPIFNKWVGLPGFAAIVDVKTKRVIGCVNNKFDTSEMASEIRQMASKAKGNAYVSKASNNAKTTACPKAHNVDHQN